MSNLNQTNNMSFLSSEKEDLKIKWACTFVDGRSHATFNDSTSLILHKGHGNVDKFEKCLSYFSRIGTKLRFLIKTIPCTEKVEAKVNLLLKHINLFNDIPVILSENLYLEEEEFLNEQKIGSCIWNVRKDEDKYFLVDEEGGVSITSVEGHAKLTILKNKFIIKVEYLQLSPKKKATLEDDKETEQSREFDFRKDFLQKYNLNKDHQIKKSSVRLLYSYIKLVKYYTIFSFPDRWALPLFLLWSRIEEQGFQVFYGKETNLAFKPQFQQDFLSYFGQFQYKQQKSDQEDLALGNYIREKYGASYINQEEVATELPSVGMSSQIISSKITSNNLWKQDDAMPSFDKPKYSERLLYVWKEGNLCWVSNESEIFVFNQETQDFIFSTQQGKFLHEVKENDLEDIKQNEKIINLFQIWKQDKKTLLLCEFQNLREHDSYIAQNKTIVTSTSKNEDDSLYSDNYELFHSCENQNGKFDAFKNGCIKILFRDRTILRWMKGQNCVHLISRFGNSSTVLIEKPYEFQNYVDQAVEYREHCFGDPKEKIEKELRKQELNEMVNFEISKNQRLLTILSGKVPLQEENHHYRSEQQNSFTQSQELPESMIESYDCSRENIQTQDINFMVQQQNYLFLYFLTLQILECLDKMSKCCKNQENLDESHLSQYFNKIVEIILK